MTPVEIAAAVAACITSFGGVGGFVAWRRSRVDIAGQLHTHWAAAIERENKYAEQLGALQADFAAHRTEAAERERELLARVAEMSEQLADAKRAAENRELVLLDQIAALRREVGATTTFEPETPQ